MDLGMVKRWISQQLRPMGSLWHFFLESIWLQFYFIVLIHWKEIWCLRHEKEWTSRTVHALLILGLLHAGQLRSGAAGWLLAPANTICFGCWGKEHFVESQPSQPRAYFCLESVESRLEAGSRINRGHGKWDWMLGTRIVGFVFVTRAFIHELMKAEMMGSQCLYDIRARKS